ncbi:hypothetical protein ACFVP3_17875 [Streptomyces sp. NPDC057806]|uniref:hypothetical protein n=1 Tax=Streptomyces sp. NPDC057806 TaxID=3346255 RepID=UPI0036ABF07A
MKIQERTGAGAGRSAAPAQPSVGDRLPTPPRERKPALAALAVLLILVGALGATMLVLQAGDRIEVVQVTDDIQAGGSVGDNITSVLVADDDSINYVMWEERAALEGYKAKSTIYKGTLVIGEMLTKETGVTQGKATVGLSLKAGQYPSGLKPGDTVAAYRVGTTGGSSNSNSNDQDSSGSAAGGNDTLIVDQATVTSVPGAGGEDIVASSNLAVTLTVDADKAALLAQAASNNEVALVLVPGSN